MHWNMPGTFYDYLNIVLPCDSGQFAQRFQFSELGRVIRIGNGAWTQAISQRKRHVVLFQQPTNVLEMGI